MHTFTTSVLLGLIFILTIPVHSNTATSPSSLTVHSPIYHIPLRVHLGKSERPAKQWLPILEEMNIIWLSQAGICFEMETVMHDDVIEKGLDIWFESTLPDWNGYFTGPNDIHVRDNPDLRPAENPAESSAARTAAHELGHALGLQHRQNSDDNLMRSKTYGWQLSEDEIIQARNAAKQMPYSMNREKVCPLPTIQE